MFQHSESQIRILKALGTYGIVQILAQDLGIKSGKKQVELVHKLPVQVALLYAGAYLTVEDAELAAITTGLYFFLKYVYSEGITTSL